MSIRSEVSVPEVPVLSSSIIQEKGNDRVPLTRLYVKYFPESSRVFRVVVGEVRRQLTYSVDHKGK